MVDNLNYDRLYDILFPMNVHKQGKKLGMINTTKRKGSKLVVGELILCLCQFESKHTAPYCALGGLGHAFHNSPLEKPHRHLRLSDLNLPPT